MCWCSSVYFISVHFAKCTKCVQFSLVHFCYFVHVFVITQWYAVTTFHQAHSLSSQLQSINNLWPAPNCATRWHCVWSTSSDLLCDSVVFAPKQWQGQLPLPCKLSQSKNFICHKFILLNVHNFGLLEISHFGGIWQQNWNFEHIKIFLLEICSCVCVSVLCRMRCAMYRKTVLMAGLRQQFCLADPPKNR